MSIRRLVALFVRDLGRGPRSPTFLYALFMPIIITLVTKVVMMTLFDPMPRLGFVDLGESEISAAIHQLEGIATTTVESPEVLRELVESNDFDAGLILTPGFDEAVRAGERPKLGLLFSGEGRYTNRIILGVHSVDLIRHVDGRPAPVQVVSQRVGSVGLPWEDLVVLGIMLWPLLVCSTLVPGLMLAQEREHRTLSALLVTPTTMSEILLSKSLLGFSMAMVMCFVTLAMCGAMPANPLPLFVVLAVSIAMCCELGMFYGTLAADGKAVYNMAQMLNVFLLAPLIFYFFPAWPQWPAKLFPTWWFIDPLYRIAMQGDTLIDVGPQLLVALVFFVALLWPVALLGRRMERRVLFGG
jgi:ABC-2 type transport system permease protein